MPESAEAGDTAGYAKVYPTVHLPVPAFEILSGNDAGIFAIDAGTDVAVPFDMDGNPIPTGLAPDMGAYEYQPE